MAGQVVHWFDAGPEQVAHEAEQVKGVQVPGEPLKRFIGGHDKHPEADGFAHVAQETSQIGVQL